MITPKISIVMPVWNAEKYLDETILSLLNQTYKDFELITIDDGSSDSSLSILYKYAKIDSRIIVLENGVNKGISKTRNRGIELARGEYIANFDNDDVAENIWLETQIEYLENNKEISVCGANINIIDKYGKKITKLIYPENDRDIKATLYFVCPFSNNTTLIRKKSFDEIGLNDENIGYIQDLDLWYRFAENNYIFHNTQKYLVNYRVHGNNSIIKKRKEMIKNTIELMKKYNAFKKIRLNFSAISFLISSFFKFSYIMFIINFRKNNGLR